jgi:glycosyltransferase involved in cell wall biosynthesis
MRIVIVNSGLRYGGAEKQIVELSKELLRRGHAVAIYTLTSDVPRLAELDGSGIDVVVDNKRGKLDLALLWRLRRFIKSYRADLLHGFLYDGNIYARVAAAGLGVPVLNSERSDDYTLRRSQIWPHRLTKHLADGVVANTWTGRDFAKRMFGLPDHRMHVVSNGVRLEDVAARIAESKENYRDLFFAGADVRVACLVGAVIPSKDYLLALSVADRLTRVDDRWRVLFVGDSFQGVFSYKVAEAETSQKYRSQVQARYEGLKLQGRAVFAGQRADALEIMAQSDVLFSTSRREGFPNVVLEAMSVCLPVVTVEYSDIRRILPLHWQVTERAPEALVQTILRAAAERDTVSARQIEWVRANATIERAAEKLETVYRQYVRQSG